MKTKIRQCLLVLCALENIFKCIFKYETFSAFDICTF